MAQFLQGDNAVVTREWRSFCKGIAQVLQGNSAVFTRAQRERCPFIRKASPGWPKSFLVEQRFLVHNIPTIQIRADSQTQPLFQKRILHSNHDSVRNNNLGLGMSDFHRNMSFWFPIPSGIVLMEPYGSKGFHSIPPGLANNSLYRRTTSNAKG